MSPRVSPPPKKCPVCSEQIWSDDEQSLVWTFIERYRTHTSTFHPKFAIWDRRTFFAYYAITGLSIGISAAMGIEFQSRILLGLGLVSWLVAIAAFWTFVKHRGIKRFHAEWNEEHGGPLNDLNIH